MFSGHWAVKVVRGGTFTFELRRWPEESGLAIREGVKAQPPRRGCLPSYSNVVGKALPIVSATLRIDGEDLETQTVGDRDQVVRFVRELGEGSYRLSPYFTQQREGRSTVDRSLGCYYVTVTRSED